MAAKISAEDTLRRINITVEETFKAITQNYNDKPLAAKIFLDFFNSISNQTREYRNSKKEDLLDKYNRNNAAYNYAVLDKSYIYSNYFDSRDRDSEFKYENKWISGYYPELDAKCKIVEILDKFKYVMQECSGAVFVTNLKGLRKIN